MNIYPNKRKSRLILFTILLVASEIIDTSFFVIAITILLLLCVLNNNGYIYIGKVSRPVLMLSFILLIGISQGVFNSQVKTIDFIRDIFYVCAPIVYLLFSYNVSRRKIISEEDIMDSFIYAGLIMTIIHYGVICVVFKFNILEARGSVVGYESIVTCIAFILLLMKKNKFHKLMRIFFLSAMLLSMIMFLSRTMSIMFLIMVLFQCVSIRKIKAKQITKIFVLSVGIIAVVYWLAQTMDLNFFGFKIINSITEISMQQNWSIENINTNWRGYERYLITNEMNSANLFHYMFGFGFGKLLNLNMSIDLAGTTYSEIGVFHSGFYYVYYKTGFVGFVCLCLFLLAIFRSFKKFENPNLKKFLFSVVVFATVQLLVSSGFLEAGYYASIMLICGFYLGEYQLTAEKAYFDGRKNPICAIKQGSTTL